PLLTLRFGSFSSSQSQSTMSSILSSSTNWYPPSSFPPSPLPGSRSAGLASASPGLPSPWPTPPPSPVSRKRKRECSRNRTGTCTVLSARGSTSLLAISSGSFSLTAERTLSLWRSQSRAPREKRSYQLRSAPGRSMKSEDLVSTSRYSPLFLRQQRRDV